MRKIIPILILSFISFSAFAENYDHSGIYFGLSGQNIRSNNQVKTADPSIMFGSCGHYAFGCGEDLNMNNWELKA